MDESSFTGRKGISTTWNKKNRKKNQRIKRRRRERRRGRWEERKRRKEGRKESRKEMREAGREDHCYTLSPWVWNCKVESQRENSISNVTQQIKQRGNNDLKRWVFWFSIHVLFATLSWVANIMLRGSIASWNYFLISPHFDTAVNCWSLGKLFFRKRD